MQSMKSYAAEIGQTLRGAVQDIIRDENKQKAAVTALRRNPPIKLIKEHTLSRHCRKSESGAHRFRITSQRRYTRKDVSGIKFEAWCTLCEGIDSWVAPALPNVWER